jgi:quercetin dioxygenase-like cupin family protein
MPRFIVEQNGTTLQVFHAKKGEGLPKHEHLFSHLTFCHSGSCLVKKDNKELRMTKDTQPVNLAANEWHEIEALEDDTIFVNVFAKPIVCGG